MTYSTTRLPARSTNGIAAGSNFLTRLATGLITGTTNTIAKSTTGIAAKLTVTKVAELTTELVAGDKFHNWVRCRFGN